MCVLSVEADWSCECVRVCEKGLAKYEAVNQSQVLELVLLGELMDERIEELEVIHDNENFSSEGWFQMLQEKKFIDKLLN